MDVVFKMVPVDSLPFGAEFYDWHENACGHKGHLISSRVFLQALFFQDGQIRNILFAGE
jgi:hypothetical protein